MNTEVNLIFRCYYFESGSQGAQKPLFTKRTTVKLDDGYLDDEDWQKATLDHCHSLHLWQAAKWEVTPHFELEVGGEQVASFSHGGGRKAPNVPSLVMAVTIELIKKAEADGLRPREEPQL